MLKKTYNQTPKPRDKKKIALVTAGGTAVVVLVLGGLQKAEVIHLPFISRKAPAAVGSTINYGPPTEEEKKETEVFKESQGATQTPATPQKDSSSRNVVTPIVSSWGQNKQNKVVSVSGYVSGIVENGGTCTLTLKNGSQTVTQDKSATQNAQTVSCGFIDIEGSRLFTGTWSVALSYSSSSSAGTSQPISIEVM